MMLEDEYDDMDESKRQTRNRNEKKRRDQFNVLVSELSSMVCTGNKKMDKSSVLKNAISYLKNHNDSVQQSREHDIQEEWKPAFLSNEEFTYLVLEALDGFIIVFSEAGAIYYTSESITSLLGHLPEDVLKMSFADLVADEDRRQVQLLLDNAVKGNEVKFQCRIRKRSLNPSEDPVYQHVQFTGYIQANKNLLNGNFVMQNDDTISKLLVVCTGRLAYPQILRDNSLLDAARKEFSSRHSLEWKFLFLDHRAPPIIGYLPFEVLGTSGYDYYHFDDLEKIVTCHKALMKTGAMTSGYYRFLTKGHQWIWLQSCFYITYHQWNSKPEFIVCTHRVVSYKDVLNDSVKECHKKEERRKRRRARRLAPPLDGNDRAAEVVIKVPQTPEMSVRALVTPEAYPQPLYYPHSTGLQHLTGVAPPTVPPSPYHVDNISAVEGNNQVFAQEELQRKHQHLQQVIVRQQAELQRVKHQLLLAMGISGTAADEQQHFRWESGSDMHHFPTNHHHHFQPN